MGRPSGLYPFFCKFPDNNLPLAGDGIQKIAPFLHHFCALFEELSAVIGGIYLIGQHYNDNFYSLRNSDSESYTKVIGIKSVKGDGGGG